MLRYVGGGNYMLYYFYFGTTFNKKKYYPMSLGSVFGSVLLKACFSKGVQMLKENLKQASFKLTIESHQLDHALNSHLKRNLTWCQSFEGLNLKDDKTVAREYIDLEYYLSTRANHIVQQLPEIKLVDTVFNRTDKHIAIVGEAGMGKTSSMKKITHKCFTDEQYLPVYSCPIVVLCRDIITSKFTEENNYLITGYLQAQFGILAAYLDQKFKDFTVGHHLIRNHIWEYIDNLHCLLIVDGFDELPIWQQTYAYRELNEMSHCLNNSKIVVTSRTANFNYNPGNIHIFEIAPFNDLQIKDFAVKWLGQQEGILFYNLIHESGFSGVSGQPLILSYMASLYEISKKIPAIPRSLYRQILDILLYKWDRARSLTRESEYENFDYDTKFTFLSHLAFNLLSNNHVTFDKNTLSRAYHEIKESYPSLPKDNVDKVIDEIRKHCGLIILNGFDTYQFSHKSFQEYLSGFYISQFNPIDEIKDSLLRLPIETAMATVLSNNPSHFLSTIIDITEHLELHQAQYIELYFGRLIKEKGNFTANSNLGYALLILWNKLYSKEKLSDVTWFMSLLNLNGISESIDLVGKIYRPDHSALLSSKVRSDPNALIAITLRQYSPTYVHRMYVPLYAIKNWNYVNHRL